MEKTLLIVKPDGVERGLVGEIISRFERVGLKIRAMKMVRADKDFLGKHYKDDEGWYKNVGTKTSEFYKEHGKNIKKELGTDDPIEIGKKVREWLLDYVSMGPVVAMVLEGPHAVELVRKHVGSTYPLTAPPGTIRGDYYYDSPALANFGKRAVYNMTHASGNTEEAEFEISLWFAPEEICA